MTSPLSAPEVGAPTPSSGGNRDGAQRIVVARSFDEVEALRDRWAELQSDAVMADIDYFQAIVRTDPNVERPHVVLLEIDGRPAALALGRLERVELGARLGYWRFYRPKVRSITVVPGGVLGAPDEAVSAALVDALRLSLAGGEADVAIVRHLPVDSAMFHAATTMPSFLARQHVVTSQPHYFLELPETFDEYLASRTKSTRYRLTRYRRKLERELGDRVDVRVFASPADVDEYFEQVDAIAGTTYQAGLGVGFVDNERNRALTMLAMSNGWFAGYVLSVDGAPGAFLNGVLYRGRLRVGHTGYDPAFRDLRLGSVLFLQLVEDLCARPDASLIDFDYGKAEYKALMANVAREEADAIVYGPTFRAARINVVRSALTHCTAAIERVGRWAGLGERAKRAVRRRASTTTESSSAG